MLSYGLTGIYRVNFVFEENINKLFAEAGIKADNCGFVQMLAANPDFKGKGSAGRLLEWQIQRHAVQYPGFGVCLDTTTEAGVRAYLRLGFEETGKMAVKTGTDATGIKLREDADEEGCAEAMRVCIQRVMIQRA